MIKPYFLENFWVGSASLFTVLTPALFLIILLLCSLPNMFMSDRNQLLFTLQWQPVGAQACSG